MVSVILNTVAYIFLFLGHFVEKVAKKETFLYVKFTQVVVPSEQEKIIAEENRAFFNK